MRFPILCLAAATSLSGCIMFSTSPATPKPTEANAKNYNLNQDIVRTQTKGQVICEPAKPCTELTFDWKRVSHNSYKVTTDLYDQEKFNIEGVVFNIDGKEYPYKSEAQTTSRLIVNSNITNSSNYVVVPASVVKSLSHAKDAHVSVMTEKGEIKHAVIKGGKESLAYMTFMRGYNQKAKP